MDDEINLKGVQLLLAYNDSEAAEVGWPHAPGRPLSSNHRGLKVGQDPWTNPAKVFPCGVLLRLVLRMKAAAGFAIWLWFALNVSSTLLFPSSSAV